MSRRFSLGWVLLEVFLKQLVIAAAAFFGLHHHARGSVLLIVNRWQLLKRRLGERWLGVEEAVIELVKCGLVEDIAGQHEMLVRLVAGHHLHDRRTLPYQRALAFINLAAAKH